MAKSSKKKTIKKNKKEFKNGFIAALDAIWQCVHTVLLEYGGEIAITMVITIIGMLWALIYAIAMSPGSADIDLITDLLTKISSFDFFNSETHPILYVAFLYFTCVIGIIGPVCWCFIMKDNLPILSALWTKPRGNNIKNLLIGFGIGFLMNGICILVAALTGQIEISYVKFEFLPLLLILICVFIQSSSEEIVCRGYLQQRLYRRHKPWVAIVFSSVIFSLLHIFNDGVTFMALLDIAFCGISFALMVHYFDSIWMAMGAHTAWNYMQNIIFGLPNSGMPAYYSIFKLDSCPGGFAFDPVFGVEGTIIAVVVEVIACVAIFLIGRKLKIKRYDVWKAAKHGKK